VCGQRVCPNDEEFRLTPDKGRENIPVVLVHAGLLVAERREADGDGSTRIGGARSLREGPRTATQLSHQREALGGSAFHSPVTCFVAVQ
jgi:hypothetical protein